MTWIKDYLLDPEAKTISDYYRKMINMVNKPKTLLEAHPLPWHYDPSVVCVRDANKAIVFCTDHSIVKKLLTAVNAYAPKTYVSGYYWGKHVIGNLEAIIKVEVLNGVPILYYNGNVCINEWKLGKYLGATFEAE